MSHPKCPVHSVEMSCMTTRYGPRWECIAPGCTMVKWGGGTPADLPTRRARQEAHAAFDMIWKEAPRGERRRARSRAYAKLAEHMGITPKECHIRKFDVDQCRVVIDWSRNPEPERSEP